MESTGGRDPLKDLLNVQKRMNQLFESALARTDFEASEGVDSWTPVSDVFEAGDRFVLCLELPGMKQADIEVRLDGDELIVEGQREMEHDRHQRFHRVERSYGKFARRFNLPASVDRQAVQASYRLGVLRIELRRRAVEGPDAIRVPVE